MVNRKTSLPVKAKLSKLAALTSTALMLPGLFHHSSQAAEDDSVDFQYSHYQENKRGIYGSVYDLNAQAFNPSTKLPNNLNPIEVDSVHGSARVTLTDRVKFAFNYTQDTWSGATPIGTAPAVVNGNRAQGSNSDGSGTVTGASPLAHDIGGFFLDIEDNIYSAFNSDPNTALPVPGFKDNQLTHILTTASPETRKQGNFKLSYEWDEAAVDIGGGISVENDYESRFVNLGGRIDFNQKQTVVNLGLGYTNSDTQATLDPDSLQFIDTSEYDISFLNYLGTDQSGRDNYVKAYKANSVPAGQVDNTFVINPDTGQWNRTSAVLRGNRQDWGTQLGLTQVLNKNATVELDMGYTRSTGYLGNPYKVVYTFFANPFSNQDLTKPISYGGIGRLEVRPDERNLFNWHFGYNQYIEPFDAALHFDYSFAHDDWGINAHTFEAEWVQPLGAGWTLTPRIRYYSQSGADFYAPFITSVQVLDPITYQNVDSHVNKALPTFYSSDQRLSGFGTLSGGLTLSKHFTKGIQLETGFEYYTHQGSLELGGGGEKEFANYDFWVVNAAVKVNLSALRSGGSYHNGHSKPHHHQPNSPAGVMFDHALATSGDMMVGYRFMRNEQAGNMLHGAQAVSLDNVKRDSCGDQECSVSPKFMAMNMHMLDLMYAPTGWLTLMLMPQWMDMEMNMTPLAGEPTTGHNHGGAVHSHQTGGIGDTGLYALFKLFGQPGHHLNLSLGGTAPTGDVGIILRRTNTNPFYNIPIHYGMQLGSGTWDFKPSLTYVGERDKFAWGAQITGTKRLENRNKSGFAFGDIFQGSVWGGYQWNNWLSTTVRGVYTSQSRVHGAYRPTLINGVDPNTGLPELVPYISQHAGPFDQPANYGGQLVDLGFGVNVTVSSGAFAGNSFKFEWLQPVHTDYNGYQLDRDGALNVTWNYGL